MMQARKFRYQTPHGCKYAGTAACSGSQYGDRKGALQALRQGQSRRKLYRVQSLLADGGYVGAPFAQGVREILGKHVQLAIHPFGLLEHLAQKTMNRFSGWH
jgi:hypothetical protein